MKAVFFVAMSLALAGCGTVVSTWEKPGATEAEEQAIGKKCVYEAEAAAQEGLTTDSARKERVRKLRDLCFEANGMVLIKREVVTD